LQDAVEKVAQFSSIIGGATEQAFAISRVLEKSVLLKKAKLSTHEDPTAFFGTISDKEFSKISVNLSTKRLQMYIDTYSCKPHIICCKKETIPSFRRFFNRPAANLRIHLYVLPHEQNHSSCLYLTEEALHASI
jgi:hypothetical protein